MVYLPDHLPDQSTIFNHDIIYNRPMDPKKWVYTKKVPWIPAMPSDALKPSRIGFPNLRWFRWMRARPFSVKLRGRIESLKTWMTQGTFLGMNLFQVLVTFHGFLPQKIVFISWFTSFFGYTHLLIPMTSQFTGVGFLFYLGEGWHMFSDFCVNDISTWKNTNTFFP